MSVAFASVMSGERAAPSLKLCVERILGGATADGDEGEEPLAWAALPNISSLAARALFWRQPTALQKTHRALRRLYDLQLAPTHMSEAKHPYNVQFMVVRAKLKHAGMQNELEAVSTFPIAPAQTASIIRNIWRTHSSFDHPIFDFVEPEANREKIALYFTCDYILNMRFCDVIAPACMAVDEEARGDVIANLRNEIGRDEYSRTHVTRCRNVLGHIKSPSNREGYLAMLGWEGFAGYNPLMHLGLVRRQHFRYISAFAITQAFRS